jgi:carboxylesterase type B
MYEYHGTGASPWYDGSRFARDGITCVTINYRVAADGFLYLGDRTANLGLLDQLARSHADARRAQLHNHRRAASR